MKKFILLILVILLSITLGVFVPQGSTSAAINLQVPAVKPLSIQNVNPLKYLSPSINFGLSPPCPAPAWLCSAWYSTSPEPYRWLLPPKALELKRGRRVVSLTTSDTKSTFLTLLADESVDVIEMAAGTYHLPYTVINIDRTRPIVVRPAAGATVILSGSDIGPDPQFGFGFSGTAGNITMQGLIFDGFILGQQGIIQAFNCHDISLNDMVVRNSRSNGIASPNCSIAIYITSTKTVFVTNFTANRWTVEATNRQMSALQVYGGNHVTAIGWVVSNACYAVYASGSERGPLTDLILDDWTISNTGTPAWGYDNVSVAVENASGNISNVHATASGVLTNVGSPKLVEGGGNITISASGLALIDDADATQVNKNFDDIISGVGDVTTLRPHVVSFALSDTAATFLTLLADEMIDVIEMATGTYHLPVIYIDIDRTRPVVVRPAAGATVVLSGANIVGGAGQFEIGDHGRAGNITMQGLIFDGFILQQIGIIHLFNAHDITLNDMVVRNSRANGTTAAPYHSWAVYITSTATVIPTNITVNCCTIDGSARGMSALQVYGGSHITATGWSVTHAYFAIYACSDRGPLTDFVLDDWTISDTSSSGNASVYFKNSSGTYSNLHATGSGALINSGTPNLIDGGGNSL